MTQSHRGYLDASLWSWFPELDAHANIVPNSTRRRLGTRDRVYLIFVEDVSKLGAGVIDAPDGTSFVPRHVVFEGSVWRYRTSAMLAADILPELPSFEALVGGGTTEIQRDNRRKQLNDLFLRVSVPVIDIFINERDEEFAALRATLLPGSWYLLTWRIGADRKSARPVYIGAPEIGEAGTFERGALRFIAPVSPPLEISLRDIFSLAHVPDATMFGPESAPAALPPGLPPDSPDGTGQTGLVRTMPEYSNPDSSSGYERPAVAVAQAQSY